MSPCLVSAMTTSPGIRPLNLRSELERAWEARPTQPRKRQCPSSSSNLSLPAWRSYHHLQTTATTPPSPSSCYHRQLHTLSTTRHTQLTRREPQVSTLDLSLLCDEWKGAETRDSEDSEWRSRGAGESGDQLRIRNLFLSSPCSRNVEVRECGGGDGASCESEGTSAPTTIHEHAGKHECTYTHRMGERE